MQWDTPTEGYTEEEEEEKGGGPSKSEALSLPWTNATFDTLDTASIES